MRRLKAAYEIGINPKTVERETLNNGTFLMERDEAELYAVHEVVEAHFQSAISGNVQAQINILKHKLKEEFGEEEKPLPGSSPATPLYVAPGHIDWDAIPDDLADEFLEVHRKILALQPQSGGLVLEGEGQVVE
jgi:hypothetical protein